MRLKSCLGKHMKNQSPFCSKYWILKEWNFMRLQEGRRQEINLASVDEKSSLCLQFQFLDFQDFASHFHYMQFNACLHEPSFNYNLHFYKTMSCIHLSGKNVICFHLEGSISKFLWILNWNFPTEPVWRDPFHTLWHSALGFHWSNKGRARFQFSVKRTFSCWTKI